MIRKQCVEHSIGYTYTAAEICIRICCEVCADAVQQSLPLQALPLKPALVLTWQKAAQAMQPLFLQIVAGALQDQIVRVIDKKG